MNPFKGFGRRVNLGFFFKSEPCKHSIGHARLRGKHQSVSQIVVIQVIKKAPFGRIIKLSYIVLDILLNKVCTRSSDRICKVCFTSYVTKAVFKCFCDFDFVTFFDLPKFKRNIVKMVGITYVEYVFKVASTTLFSYECNTLCTAIYPSSKVYVPHLQLSTRSCEWSLSVD
ncbi:MAG: hypothetical protein IJV87_01035 [Clostridia bacterium]|nr:hypothetical protein [Clostridia bacterium]